jgi:predicted ABC-type ATPase
MLASERSGMPREDVSSRKPVVYVLGGVNGAGKSSIGGAVLRGEGAQWYNPDAYARELVVRMGMEPVQANATAWEEGVRRLDAAVAGRRNFAFETTLGGRTIPARLRAAMATHDVLMWFCGLASPEQHIARVRARVAAGGHDIPEARIRERCSTSLLNLIGLMPHLAYLSVYDNSVDVDAGEPLPDPRLVLEMQAGRLLRPRSARALRATPEWAKSIVAAALALEPAASPAR